MKKLRNIALTALISVSFYSSVQAKGCNEFDPLGYYSVAQLAKIISGDRCDTAPQVDIKIITPKESIHKKCSSFGYNTVSYDSQFSWAEVQSVKKEKRKPFSQSFQGLGHLEPRYADQLGAKYNKLSLEKYEVNDPEYMAGYLGEVIRQGYYVGQSKADVSLLLKAADKTLNIARQRAITGLGYGITPGQKLKRETVYYQLQTGLTELERLAITE